MLLPEVVTLMDITSHGHQTRGACLPYPVYMSSLQFGIGCNVVDGMLLRDQRTVEVLSRKA